MIVVTGATGNIGRPLVQQLLELGAPVRAVVRDPDAADLPGGVELVRGDLGDAPASAFEGADAAFLMPGYPGLAGAARDGGVGRVVQLSGGSAGGADETNAVTRYLRATEAEARATGLPVTYLRPSAFSANALRWLPQLREGDVVRGPFGDVPLACVDPADIAAVAACALTEAGHEHMIYRLTGPDSLLPAQQVATLAEVLDRPLRFEAIDNATARRQMLADTPAPYVAAFFDFYVNGTIDDSTVHPTVADVTGRPPRSFRDWASDNAARFA